MDAVIWVKLMTRQSLTDSFFRRVDHGLLSAHLCLGQRPVPDTGTGLHRGVPASRLRSETRAPRRAAPAGALRSDPARTAPGWLVPGRRGAGARRGQLCLPDRGARHRATGGHGRYGDGRRGAGPHRSRGPQAAGQRPPCRSAGGPQRAAAGPGRPGARRAAARPEFREQRQRGSGSRRGGCGEGPAQGSQRPVTPGGQRFRLSPAGEQGRWRGDGRAGGSRAGRRRGAARHARGRPGGRGSGSGHSRGRSGPYPFFGNVAGRVSGAARQALGSHAARTVARCRSGLTHLRSPAGPAGRHP